MTSAQKKHLEQRMLGAINVLKERIKRPGWEITAHDPAHIRKLNKVVQAGEKRLRSYKEQRTKTREKERAKVERLARPVRELLLFGDSQKALKAVKELERKAGIR